MSTDQAQKLGNALRSRAKALAGDCSGATSIEYALIATGIAAAIATVVLNLGEPVKAKYDGVYEGLANGGQGGG